MGHPARDHPAAIVTQSAIVYDRRVYVGWPRRRSAGGAGHRRRGYPCCSFRGGMLALDLDTGAILWKAYTVPAGYSGGAIWGTPRPSTPAEAGLRRDRQQLLDAAAAQACVLAAGATRAIEASSRPTTTSTRCSRST